MGTEMHDYIAEPPQLASLFDELAVDTDGHKDPRTKVLLREIRSPTAEIAAKLLVRPDEPVLRLRRLRTAGGEPLAIFENYLPARVGDISGADLASGSLFQALRTAGLGMRVTSQRIGARDGTDEECEILHEPRSSPVMTMEQLTHEDSGHPIEFGRHVYRASKYEFIIRLER